MNISVIVAMAYLFVTTIIIISYTQYKAKKQDMKSFYLSSDGLGPVMITALVFSEVVAAAQVVGAAEAGFTTGLMRYGITGGWRWVSSCSYLLLRNIAAPLAVLEVLLRWQARWEK